MHIHISVQYSTSILYIYQLITAKFIKMRDKESRHCAVVNRALGVQ